MLIINIFTLLIGRCHETLPHNLFILITSKIKVHRPKTSLKIKPTPCTSTTRLEVSKRLIMGLDYMLVMGIALGYLKFKSLV